MEEDQYVLYWETDRRFWKRTNYKRGKWLDMHDSNDRQMAKIWWSIFAEVRAIRDRATREAATASSKNRTAYVVVYQSDTGSWNAVPIKSSEQLPAAYQRGVDAPEMFSYVAMFDFGKNRRGPVDDHFASEAPPSRTAGWGHRW